MGERSMISIGCGISKLLESNFTQHEVNRNLKVEYIHRNQEYEGERYNLLVLDKNKEGMYSGVTYRSENLFDAVAYYDPSFNTTSDLTDAVEVLIHLLNKPGVINHQQLITLMKVGIIVYDGSIINAKGASYDLTIDKEHLRSGIEVVERDVVEIEPFDYVVACARESVNLPRNVCGSFDLKVSMFCRGIILSNGPQVDPGYQGRLLCLLFNTSSEKHIMEANIGYHFATVQFQVLSSSTDMPYAGKYGRKKEVKDYIAAYANYRITERMLSISKIQGDVIEISKKIGNVSKQIDAINNDQEKLENKVAELKGSSVKWLAIFVTVISVLVAIYLGIRFDFVYEKIGKLETELKQLTQGTPIYP
jgi:deoxycytidine triphosphate deaminase